MDETEIPARGAKDPRRASSGAAPGVDGQTVEAALTPVRIRLATKRRLKPELPLRRTKFAVLPTRALDDTSLSDGALRTLALICSHASRAGITWVSQQKIAAESGKRREVINQHFRDLKRKGIIEPITKHGVNGLRGATIRVIFDPTISTKTAIARAGNGQEDVDMMPPEEQKARIAQMLAGIIKPVNQPNQRRYNMPAGETEAVKRIKAGLKKPKQPVDKSVDNPVDNSKKVLEKDHTNYIKTIGISINVEDSKELLTVLEQVTFNEFVEYADQVMERRHAEGLPAPSLANFVESVLLAQQQYLENALERATSDDRGAG